MRAVLRLLFPGAVVGGAAVAIVVVGLDEGLVTEGVQTYGRVVYGAGLALAWVFHRSRVFILLFCIGTVDLQLAGEGGLTRFLALDTVLVTLTGVLALTRDRGVLSRAGVAQASFSALLLVVGTAAFSDPARIRTFLVPPALPFELPLWPDLSLAAVGAVSVGLVGTVFGFYRWRGPVDRGLIWGVVLLGLGMHPGVGSRYGSLMMVAAGLVLTLSVVETSYLLAYRDDLTGLPGRRALMQVLDGIVGTYTMAMVDVDHFKDFNDKHGHDVGDQVLRMVASRLGRTPGGAKAYRYGGEEFTLLFPGRTKEEAKPHLEAVLETIENSKFTLRSWRRPRKKPEGSKTKAKRTRKAKSLSVTVSIGMADNAGDDDHPDVVLKRSDQALYRAKKKGRNRVSK